jgi:UDP:flavonoid glycosyltransferase YjiC (YdhE family)
MAVPFGYDQPLWGARLEALGVGPSPIAAQSLTAASLAAALRRLTTDVGMRARARAIGEVIRSENGLGRAVATVLATLDGVPSRRAVP